MKVLVKHKQIIFLLVVLLFSFLFFILLPKVFSSHYLLNSNLGQNSTASSVSVFVPTYISTPGVVKGIYMTSWTAGSKKLRDALIKLIDETELNTVVIDIKDYTGRIAFPITNPELKAYGSEEVHINDLRDFIESLHKKGIYIIGRIAVFQDAYFVKYRPDLAVKNKAGTAVWKDKKGISWIDPGSREYWDYIVLLSKEARRIGFDEINFDYIRFPSDGNMQDISYRWSSTTPKALVLKEFFSYLHNNLVEVNINNDSKISEPTLSVGSPTASRVGADHRLRISADLFGMTTTAENDMGIGQVFENTLPYFDYVSPMVYPSHYPPTFEGLKDPEAYPYEVVHSTMQSAVTRTEAFASTTGQSLTDYKNKLRPWLQDFGLRMDYGPAEVRAQIKAINDLGLSSWLLWSSANKYTRDALESNQAPISNVQ
ncbi:MAG: hypothetical protein HY507_00730 [Candidatus Zambryskibacteria bacterium]|nr:hypothetical protein [Candidatus Zambryskibacteria bacterium]